MLAVLVEIDLHLPMARGLKDKRGVIRRLQSRLRQDLGVSVAEVDHQDLWQRATLGVAIATADAVVGHNVAREVERIAARAHEAEITDVRIDTVRMEGRSRLLDLATATAEHES